VLHAAQQAPNQFMLTQLRRGCLDVWQMKSLSSTLQCRCCATQDSYNMELTSCLLYI
jgi:hypothetical protein